MTTAIWSLPKLQELLDHSEPEVQEWVVDKLFHLYPEEAARLLPVLLSDERSTVVVRTLRHLDGEPRHDILDLLQGLYLTGDEAVSAGAIRVLGDWRIEEAVALMRKRIVEGDKPLGKEQIAQMLYALGLIPGEDAYRFLKQTEESIQNRESAFWELFYASVLEHRRLEDVHALLNVVVDAENEERRRSDALGVLLAQVDPTLNPSDVFYLNHAAVQNHYQQRLQSLEEGPRGDEAALSNDIKDLVPLLEPDLSSQASHGLRVLASKLKGSFEYAEGIAARSTELLEKDPGSDQWHYGLLCLAFSSLVKAFEERVFPRPNPDARWEEKLSYVLRNTPRPRTTDPLVHDIIKEGDRRQLISILTSAIQKDPHSWGALAAVEMLGLLRAHEGAETIIEALEKAGDNLFVEAAERALIRIGTSATDRLVPLLDSTDTRLQLLAMGLLGSLPTEEGMSALAARTSSLHAEVREPFLETVQDAGAVRFLDFLEEEYRPGEWAVGRAYVHICRVNGIQPAHYREIEQDVRRGKEFEERSRNLLYGKPGPWPSVMLMELACAQCGKQYQYEIHEMHIHPRSKEKEQEQPTGQKPYRHGVVIVDDLRCKNCHALNDLHLTQKSFAQLTAEALQMMAFQRTGLQIPQTYPVKHVALDDKDGEPRTLWDMEKDYLDAVRHHASKAAPHLALGKFYEYVKEFGKAKQAYLQALDVDATALEALAGLARITHAEGKLQEAVDWIESCYENLEKGHVYMAEDAASFKKAVRQKRREFAQELGVKPKEKPVEIRFSVDVSDYPKNKPCPCGSGKKYKLCCMPRQ